MAGRNGNGKGADAPSAGLGPGQLNATSVLKSGDAVVTMPLPNRGKLMQSLQSSNLADHRVIIGDLRILPNVGKVYNLALDPPSRRL